MPGFQLTDPTEINQDNSGFGMLSSMMGWGSLGGLMALAYLGATRRPGGVMLVCYLVYTSLLIGFAASTTYVLSLAILAIAGIFHSVAMALNRTLLLQAARDEMRGRVMALDQMAHGVQPLGSLPLAIVVSAYAVQFGIGAFMVTATVAFGVFALAWAPVRRM